MQRGYSTPSVQGYSTGSSAQTTTYSTGFPSAPVISSTPSMQGYSAGNSAQTTTYATSNPSVIYSTPSVQGYVSTPGYATSSSTFFAQPRVVQGTTTVYRSYSTGNSCCY